MAKLLSGGGITQPFLLAVVERWHNLVHSDRSRSIGHSSTEKINRFTHINADKDKM